MDPREATAGRPELGGDQVPRSLGKDIVVVKAGGASRLQQLSQAGEGGIGRHLLVQPLPHLVEGHQPGEELHLLDLRQVPGEDLVEVVVGVDEAGIDRHGGGVDDLLGLVVVRADGGDDAILDIDVDALVEGVAVVTRDDVPGVFEKQGRHRQDLLFQRFLLLFQYNMDRPIPQPQECGRLFGKN